MTNTSKSTLRSSRKSSRSETAEKSTSSSKPQKNSSPNKSEHQYIDQPRTWPTDTRSWDVITSESMDNRSGKEVSTTNTSTMPQTGSSSTTRSSNQPPSLFSSSSSRYQTTGMERWEYESQQESPWNAIGQFRDIGGRK